MPWRFTENALQLFGRSSFFVRHHASPKTLGSPDASAQTLQLHDLAVVDKEIHLCSVIFDIPCEYIGISGFEHQLVHADLIDEFCRYIRAPLINALGDSFTLDHDIVRAGFET